MTKRFVWKIGDLVNIKLRDDLFTISQMMISPTMRFYDIFNQDGEWRNIDLNKCPVLFRVFVVTRPILKFLATHKIREKTVIPGNMPYEPYWINPYSNFDGGFAWRGGKLIDLGPDGNIGYTLAPVIKSDLVLPEDRELIEKHELVNMWGPGSLRERLIRYFDTGINRDDLKFEIFPGLWDDREQLRPLTSRLPAPLR